MYNFFIVYLRPDFYYLVKIRVLNLALSARML